MHYLRIVAGIYSDLAQFFCRRRLQSQKKSIPGMQRKRQLAFCVVGTLLSVAIMAWQDGGASQKPAALPAKAAAARSGSADDSVWAPDPALDFDSHDEEPRQFPAESGSSPEYFDTDIAAWSSREGDLRPQTWAAAEDPSGAAGMAGVDGYRFTPGSGDPYNYIRTGHYAKILAHEAQAETQSWGGGGKGGDHLGEKPWVPPPTVTAELPPVESQAEEERDEHEEENTDGTEWSVIYRGGKKALEAVSG